MRLFTVKSLNVLVVLTPLPQHATELLALFLSALPRSHHLVTFSTHPLDKARAAAAMIPVRQHSL